MILIPQPWRDETIEGIHDRIGTLNALSTWEVGRALRRHFGDRDVPYVVLLARACQIAVPQLVQCHTLIPLNRAVRQPKYAFPHGEAATRPSRAGRTLGSIRTSAWYCRQCMEQDLAEKGVAYWHRSHQLHGIDWCLVHGHPLLRIPSQDFWTVAQDRSQQVAETSTVSMVAEARDHSVVQRYVDALLWLLAHDRPLPERALDVAMSRQRRARGLWSGKADRHPNLRDRANETLPTTWLRAYFPGSRWEIRAAYDIALAVALLFDSVDEGVACIDQAIAQLNGTEVGSRSPSPMPMAAD